MSTTSIIRDFDVVSVEGEGQLQVYMEVQQVPGVRNTIDRSGRKSCRKVVSVANRNMNLRACDRHLIRKTSAKDPPNPILPPLKLLTFLFFLCIKFTVTAASETALPGDGEEIVGIVRICVIEQADSYS
jgi:hypothetical protein